MGDDRFQTCREQLRRLGAERQAGGLDLVAVEIMEELIQRIEIDEGGSRDFHAERLTACREVDHQAAALGQRWS